MKEFLEASFDPLYRQMRNSFSDDLVKLNLDAAFHYASSNTVSGR